MDKGGKGKDREGFNHAREATREVDLMSRTTKEQRERAGEAAKDLGAGMRGCIGGSHSAWDSWYALSGPEFVLALLEDLKDSEERCASIEVDRSWIREACVSAVRQRDAALGRIKNLESELDRVSNMVEQWKDYYYNLKREKGL